MADLKFENILNKPIQYIDEDELMNLKFHGFDIPEEVVYIPVSLSKNPETFKKIIEIKEALPHIEIDEITDAVKSFMNGDAVSIDIKKFLQVFPGASGDKILADIQAGVPLSHEAAKTIIDNNILAPAQDSLKFKKFLPFLGIPVIPSNKAVKKVVTKAKAAPKSVKTAGKVFTNVSTFGISGLMKKIASNKKKKNKSDRFVGMAVTAGIAATKLGLKARKKILKKAKTKKAEKIAASGGYKTLSGYQKSLIPVPDYIKAEETKVITVPSVKTELPKPVTVAQKKKQAGIFDWFFGMFN